jgi:hypothetical protein
MKYYSELFQSFYDDPMDYVEELLAEGSDYQTAVWNWDLVCVALVHLDLPNTPYEWAKAIRKDLFDYNECVFESDADLNSILNVEALGVALTPFLENLSSMQPNPEKKVPHKKFLEKNMFD